MTRLRRGLRGRRAEQHGFIAITMALLVPIVFMGCAAFAMDTANWYADQRDMQKAADSAGPRGCALPPERPAECEDEGPGSRHSQRLRRTGVNRVTISVTVGNRPTQLKVTITKPVANTFGKLIGTPTTTLSRVAVADYQGPQPMGSPCNTFGNEPSQGVSQPADHERADRPSAPRR